MKINENEIIWVEKYRPQLVDDLILPDIYVNKFKEYIKNPTNILLYSETPGTGKTSTLNAIIREGEFESLFINASLENGIDVLRNKIANFASSQSFNDKAKIVILDECLEENEEVIFLDENDNEITKKLNELQFGEIYKCKSFNLKTGKIENDICEKISEKYDEIYEVELEDGRIIKVTSNHPFIVKDKFGNFIEKSINDGLDETDEIVCKENYV